jgi:epoxyqueuosine reductase
MKEAIRARALELGFDDFRVTTAAAPETGERYLSWIEARRNGAMEYLARNAPKRLDPQKVMEGVRSIVCLAVAYPEVGRALKEANVKADLLASQRTGEETLTPLLRQKHFGGQAGPSPIRWEREKPPRARSTSGIVARYARFSDYHNVISARLKTLAVFMDDLGGAYSRSLWYLDTGPILERDFAQRAGLGFIGKHTNLISRKLGNWIFLAEILTTLELEPDESERNRCGTCTRCIAACPTAAITAPFQLDARRCISYLTIELRGPIPVEFREAMGDRIFGCDDCLAACPWNRFAREGSMMKAYAREELAAPDLIGLLALDDTGFKEQFAGTPISRTKRSGLQRNVCVALGNVGDERALPALEKAANGLGAMVAEHARWAIDRIHQRGL